MRINPNANWDANGEWGDPIKNGELFKDGENVIGGDKKRPLLEFVRDPQVSQLLDMLVESQEMTSKNSIEPDSPSEAMNQWQEWQEFMS